MEERKHHKKGHLRGGALDMMSLEGTGLEVCPGNDITGRYKF